MSKSVFEFRFKAWGVYFDAEIEYDARDPEDFEVVKLTVDGMDASWLYSSSLEEGLETTLYEAMEQERLVGHKEVAWA